MDLTRRARRLELDVSGPEQDLSSGHDGASSGGYDARADRRPLPRPADGLPLQRGGWRLFAVFVLVLGLVISALSAWAWYGYVSSLRRQAVASSLADVTSILGASLQRDNELLASVNAIVATHPELTNGSLEAYLSRLDLSQNYPGTIAFAYVESVSETGLPDFEAATKADPPLGVPATSSAPVTKSLDGQPSYCLTRLAAVELLPGDDLLKDLLLEWAGPYLSAHFNFCASSYQELLDASARTGAPSVSSAVRLLVPTPGMPALPAALHAFVAELPIFVEATPVYAAPQPLTATGGRAKVLSGWTLGLFDAQQILEPALANEKDVSVVLAYGTPGARPMVLAQEGHAEAGVTTNRLSFSADPGWIVDVKVSPQGNGPSPDVQAGAVLLGSLALTLLLVILLNVLITSRRSALELVEERTAALRHQALHDPLTGLPNRSLVDQRAQRLLSRARGQGSPLAVFFIDLDDFKKVNDTLGHPAGDELLRAVAARLSAAVRGSDTVGRLGGDEFVVLSEGSFLDEGVNVVAERILSVLRQPFSLGSLVKSHLALSASIGIAAGLREGPEELLRDADIALYKAKSTGKNRYVLFEPEMHEVVKQHLALETELAEAFLNKEFFLVYQPIVDLGTEVANDVEALLRWRHPSRGVVGPDQFVPVLESSELIIDIGRFVLEEACRQARAWHDLGHPIGVSVNVAARQLRYDALIDHVRQALAAAGLAPCYLTLEVTESMLMMDSKMTAQRLAALSGLGVRIAIDDFGTGYSSISYLREFPVDILKIDRSFVDQLATGTGTNFLDALVHLGKTLGLLTIAEG
ncbi:MAG TPA: EAL domain-containing protein, partial [Acidimicrobiales bacterium]|nr:EAL domain-containing protein [Acidimicrobiales bacterium]